MNTATFSRNIGISPAISQQQQFPIELPTPCNLLIIDTETTGLDPAVDQVIELGAILYSVDHQTPLYQISTLLRASDNPAEHINHIPSAVLPTIQDSFKTPALQAFQAMVNEANFAIAHNADFDQQWFNNVELPILINRNTNAPLQWLCSMSDFTWPKQIRPGDSLANLALSHGVSVNALHRALADCQLIAALFDRLTPTELRNILLEALQPRAWYKAIISFDDRHLAKNSGFRWDGERKFWIRRMTETQAQNLPFRVDRLISN
jgi:DNA polymerase-3 subunit epsilon